MAKAAPAPPEDGDRLILRATQGATLQVQLLDASESPVAGMSVLARPAPYLGSDIGGLMAPPTPTDAAGITVIPNLLPGAYLLTVPARPELPPTGITVTEPLTQSVIRLP